MLQNEPTTQPPNPTGQNRVTPDELSRALAALEARKQAEASRLAGTIPIEEAVTQLHLDATPEEIWAEVQAQRQKPPATEAKTFAEADAARRAQFPQARPVQTPLGINRFWQRTGPPPKWASILAPVLVIWVLFTAGVIPHSWTHPASLFAPAAAPILRPLSQMPDSKEIYADDAALAQISEGKPAAQVTVSENATGNRWTLVKIGDHVYLHGYIASADSLSSLQGKALNVYNDDNSGGLERVPTSNITLRLDKVAVSKSGGDDGYSEIIVPNFQPDALTTLDAGR